MLRTLLPCSAALATCAPSPQEAAMRHPGPASETAAPEPAGRRQAALGPIPEPVSAAGNPAPPPQAHPLPTDSAAALGRRILSTAFVMAGPDGRLTVERRDGRVLVLRDVVMRPADYCGVRVGGSGKTRYCGGYAEVAAARPGGGPILPEPGPAEPGKAVGRR